MRKLRLGPSKATTLAAGVGGGMASFLNLKALFQDAMRQRQWKLEDEYSKSREKESEATKAREGLKERSLIGARAGISRQMLSKGYTPQGDIASYLASGQTTRTGMAPGLSVVGPGGTRIGGQFEEGSEGIEQNALIMEEIFKWLPPSVKNNPNIGKAILDLQRQVKISKGGDWDAMDANEKLPYLKKFWPPIARSYGIDLKPEDVLGIEEKVLSAQGTQGSEYDDAIQRLMAEGGMDYEEAAAALEEVL